MHISVHAYESGIVSSSLVTSLMLCKCAKNGSLFNDTLTGMCLQEKEKKNFNLFFISNSLHSGSNLTNDLIIIAS